MAAIALPLIAGVGGAALFRSMDQKPPAIEPPKVMPTPDDEAVRRARRRSLSAQLGRRGRQSTILSDDETLG